MLVEHPAPAFLRALDDVLPTHDGWVARCPVWGCGELLNIVGPPWAFTCDGPHSHEEVVAYLQPDTRTDHDEMRRLWRAIVLSPRLEVCEALLRGEAVPGSALDPEWCRRFGL